SSRRRHTRFSRDWSSDVCSSDLDDWQKFANLRLLLAYQFTRPGKKLLFMGSEVAQRREWDHDSSVDWHLRDAPMHGSFEHFVSRSEERRVGKGGRYRG